MTKVYEKGDKKVVFVISFYEKSYLFSILFKTRFPIPPSQSSELTTTSKTSQNSFACFLFGVVRKPMVINVFGALVTIRLSDIESPKIIVCVLLCTFSVSHQTSLSVLLSVCMIGLLTPLLLPCSQKQSLFARTSRDDVFHISDSISISITCDIPHENTSVGILEVSASLNVSHIHFLVRSGPISLGSLRCSWVRGVSLNKLKWAWNHARTNWSLSSGAAESGCASKYEYILNNRSAAWVYSFHKISRNTHHEVFHGCISVPSKSVTRRVFSQSKSSIFESNSSLLRNVIMFYIK